MKIGYGPSSKVRAISFGRFERSPYVTFSLNSRLMWPPIDGDIACWASIFGVTSTACTWLSCRNARYTKYTKSAQTMPAAISRALRFTVVRSTLRR